MTLHETTQYRGYEIKTYYDHDPDSPRSWDNLGTMYTAHRRYCPEKQFDEHFEFEKVVGAGFSFLPSFLEKYVALPIYLYDHSGLTVSTSPFSCKWDSGWFGMIAVEIEKVKKEYGWEKLTKKRRKQIEEYLLGEIETYDDYLTGQVYGFELISPEGEEIDSCWGFYGEEGLKDMISQCKSVVDGIILREWKEKLKAGIQLLIPFPEFNLSANQS